MLKLIAKVNRADVTSKQIECLIFDLELIHRDKSSVFQSFVKSERSGLYDQTLLRGTEDGTRIILTGEIKEIWSVRQVRVNFLCLMVLLSVVSMVFYMNTFYVKQFQGSLVVNTSIQLFTDTLSAILSGVLYRWLGSKKGFLFSLCLAIFSCALLVAFWNADSPLLFSAIVLLQNLGVCMAFVMVYYSSV